MIDEQLDGTLHRDSFRYFLLGLLALGGELRAWGSQTGEGVSDSAESEVDYVVLGLVSLSLHFERSMKEVSAPSPSRPPPSETRPGRGWFR